MIKGSSTLHKPVCLFHSFSDLFWLSSLHYAFLWMLLNKFGKDTSVNLLWWSWFWLILWTASHYLLQWLLGYLLYLFSHDLSILSRVTDSSTVGITLLFNFLCENALTFVPGFLLFGRVNTFKNQGFSYAPILHIVYI